MRYLVPILIAGVPPLILPRSIQTFDLLSSSSAVSPFCSILTVRISFAVELSGDSDESTVIGAIIV